MCKKNTDEIPHMSGTYTTEADGYGGVIKVETTLTDEKIENHNNRELRNRRN